MKLRTLAVLFLLAWAVTAHAFPNNYTLYVSNTTTDGNTLNFTYHITGNMLPPVPPMNGILHTPNAVFTLGSTTLNYQWQGVCPTCDMNDYAYPSAAYDLSCGDVDYPCSAFQNFTVSCQVLGRNFVSQGPSGGFSNLIFQRAISMAENAAIPIGNAGWVLRAKCTKAVSPPDFDPIALYSANFQPPPPEYFPFLKARCVCFRDGNAPSGSPWTCQPTFQYVNMSVDEASQEFAKYGDNYNYNCTNRDKGYTGKPWP